MKRSGLAVARLLGLHGSRAMVLVCMMHFFSDWLERLAGVEPGSGESAAWGLSFSWDWPPWLTLLFVVLAAGYVLRCYLGQSRPGRIAYRVGLAGLRLATIGVVLAMLAQVTLVLQRTGLPYLVLMLDDSQSMSLADRYEKPVQEAIAERVKKAGFQSATRWNQARTLLVEEDAAVLRALAANYQLRVELVAGGRLEDTRSVEALGAQLRSLEPTGESTPLGAAIRRAIDELRGTPPAAVVVLSDGIVTEGPSLYEAAAYARRRSVPLYLVGLGDDRPVRDLKITDLLADRAVFVNDVLYFEAHVSATGYEGKKARVVLRQQGKPQPLDQVDVVLGPDRQVQAVRLSCRPPEPGEFHYVVEAEPLEGEHQLDNNRQERTVQVRKEKIRVLLVSAEPSFEFRYLEAMLSRDASVELKTVLQDGDLGHAEQSRTALRSFPVQREELFRYDVVVLGDARPATRPGSGPGGLSPAMMQNLVDFVQQPNKGGALILVAGPKYMPLAYRDTPLASLLPMDLAAVRVPPEGQPAQSFQMQPTDLGLASPAMQLGAMPADTSGVWQHLPGLYWFLEISEIRPGVRVLAEHPTRRGREGRLLPLILLRYVGAGKVLFHATDETWRWRFRAGDVFFARYWVQTLRYLARSKLYQQSGVTLACDRREYRRGEPVRLSARFADPRQAPPADDGVTVLVEQKQLALQRVTLRRNPTSRDTFEATLAGLLPGEYHASMVLPASAGPAPAVDFAVLAPPGEFARIEMDSREMARAAERTKGRFYTFHTASNLLADLPEGHELPLETLPPVPLWNRWPVMLALVVLLVGEWALRKLAGLA